tara:strand:+ start:149980 stop:151209 length:1230 start_codon:yes stop_codon:yes gene_type:complete
MHRSTTVTTSPPWWKQPTVSKTIPQSAPQVELAQEYIPHNDACPTVTENAAMTGAVRVLSNEEASAKGYFSNSLGQRPCSLEERTKYFNGLGYDVVIFDSKGMYWRIPYDATNITGTFTIACRYTAANSVTVASKTTPEDIPSLISERMFARAITEGWRDTGGVQSQKLCDWESVIYSSEFANEDTLYISELNLFITKITNYLDAPYHPDAIAKIEGRSYGKGITFGAFVNWNEGERPQNYYVRICNRTRTLPLVRNHQLPTGVYRFVRDGDRPIVPVPVTDKELGVTKFWHEIPIFKTATEADNATSQNIIGQMELDALENEKRALSELHDKFDDERTKLRQEKEALEQKLQMQSLDSAKEKKELDLKLAEIKEASAKRSDAREDTSTWLKYVASVVTIGVGLWKAFK